MCPQGTIATTHEFKPSGKANGKARTNMEAASYVKVVCDDPE